MTWHRSGTTWQLMRDGEPVDELRLDERLMYRDREGRTLSRNFDEARRMLEARTLKAGKPASAAK